MFSKLPQTVWNKSIVCDSARQRWNQDVRCYDETGNQSVFRSSLTKRRSLFKKTHVFYWIKYSQMILNAQMVSTIEHLLVFIELCSLLDLISGVKEASNFSFTFTFPLPYWKWFIFSQQQLNRLSQQEINFTQTLFENC